MLRTDPSSLIDRGRVSLFISFISWRAFREATNVSLRAVRWLRARANHLSKQVNVVISFARHGFANLVQDGQEFWTTIHAKRI